MATPRSTVGPSHLRQSYVQQHHQQDIFGSFGQHYRHHNQPQQQHQPVVLDVDLRQLGLADGVTQAQVEGLAATAAEVKVEERPFAGFEMIWCEGNLF